MAENYDGIVNQSQSLFDQGSNLATTLLQLQTSASTPLVAELPTATGMVLPNRSAYDRLSHFPEELYDLRPESHLVRFVKALLGDSGAGQLRKRYLLAQLEQALDSTHFYDLDRFYGSLFGARRGVFGSLPMDPMEEVATPDGWDDISRRDGVFRERVIKLARAITLGATPMGMQALAESLTGVECDIYETWSILDAQGTPGTQRTYTQVAAAFPSYGVMESYSWGQVAGVVNVGNLGTNMRNEFIVRPKRVYDTSDPDSARQRAEDLYGIARVINVLKPAQSIASIDDKGLAVHVKVPIGSVSSDSEFWEVVPRVLPRDELKDLYGLLYTAYDNQKTPDGMERVVPRPPFSSSQGQQWSCAVDVSSVNSFTLERGDHYGQPNINFDIVTFYDGKRVAYRPEYAIIDPQQAQVAQTSGEGSITTHPYSGGRRVIEPHG